MARLRVLSLVGNLAAPGLGQLDKHFYNNPILGNSSLNLSPNKLAASIAAFGKLAVFFLSHGTNKACLRE